MRDFERRRLQGSIRGSSTSSANFSRPVTFGPVDPGEGRKGRNEFVGLLTISQLQQPALVKVEDEQRLGRGAGLARIHSRELDRQQDLD